MINYNVAEDTGISFDASDLLQLDLEVAKPKKESETKKKGKWALKHGSLRSPQVMIYYFRSFTELGYDLFIYFVRFQKTQVYHLMLVICWNLT